MSYLVLAGAIMLASLVSSRLKNKFEHYSKMQLQNGMSGAGLQKKCWPIMGFLMASFRYQDN
jgi:Zn-dependent membrane protease YugP